MENKQKPNILFDEITNYLNTQTLMLLIKSYEKYDTNMIQFEVD